MKYVVVSGGVISGIGKGIIASSTGLLCKCQGLSVTSIKIDPYLNVDAGTMAPTEHGEVFVLDDGGEVDLDLVSQRGQLMYQAAAKASVLVSHSLTSYKGNYERYLSITLTRESNITTGKIYQHVIERERRGDYLGRTVQVVPHLTDATQDWIERVARTPVDNTKREPDVCIIELGGTVGDIESGPFVESMRQLRRRAGPGNFLHIHVSLIPIVSGEQKTKPTQQAIRDVRSAGLSPDLIACRCSTALEQSTIDKIAMFCQVEPEQVIAVHDVESTYHVPMLLEKQGLNDLLAKGLRFDTLGISPKMQAHGAAIWKEWKSLTGSKDQLYDRVDICLVGKYTNLHDSYLSVIKSLEHAAMACRRKLNLIWVDASHLEPKACETNPVEYHKAWHAVCTAQGILVPGGFGTRGTEGMIAAAKWARTNKIPYLGICLGMQIAVIEFARHVVDIPNATSSEFNPRTSDPVIIPMEELDKESMGATMRLGLKPTLFEPGTEWSKLRSLYDHSKPSTASGDAGSSHGGAASVGSGVILERHRHRYEVNPLYIDRLAAKGLHFIGRDEQGLRMEVIELQDDHHPYYVGVQFHPEYLSRVLDPSKPYLGFVAASGGCLEDVMSQVKGLVNGVERVTV